MELASPFSTAFTRCWADGTIVLVDTVLVEVVVNTVGFTEEAVSPVDLRVGVTVAEGFVKAAGLLSLSTRGLMGKVTAETEVPALLGNGRGRVEGSSVTLEFWTGEGKNCLVFGLGDTAEFCLTGGYCGGTLPGVVLTGDREGRGIVGISLGKLVCTDSDRPVRPELFSDEGDGVADSDLTVVSLTGTVVEVVVEEPEVLKEIPGVLGVLGVLGRLGTLLAPTGLPPPSVSEGSLVLSSLLESSSNTDFLLRSC